jgi:two-component system chemotaxis sensor kinase CheA
MQNMLRPIVEAAGYLVIGEADELAADITIVSHGRDVEPKEGGRILRLATDPDAADGADSIYRYDRAGLLLALKSASAGRRK